jgi:hypothetical protein
MSQLQARLFRVHQDVLRADNTAVGDAAVGKAAWFAGDQEG